MGYIQIVEFQTSRIDEIETLSEKFNINSGDNPDKPFRVAITEDLDRKGTYLVIAEFDSHEGAMRHSSNANTQDFAAAMGELCDGPPKFYNLSVVMRPTEG